MHVNCIGTVISKYSDIVVYIRTCNYKTSTCNNCTNQFSCKAGQQISSVLSVFSVQHLIQCQLGLKQLGPRVKSTAVQLGLLYFVVNMDTVCVPY